MRKTALILGFFDGVHKGHRDVIGTTSDYRVLLTFSESPAKYFGSGVEYIYAREKNYEIIKSLGVDEIIEQDFSTLVNVSAEEYLEKYIIEKFHPSTISTGFNHFFGAKRLGTPDFLTKKQTKYNYQYLCSAPCKIDNEVVSSTAIRNLLKLGNIEKANKFLDSNFSLKSTVIEGEKVGRELGFPTANMEYPREIVKIPYGVYCVKVLGKSAILNWGMKPTFEGKKEVLEIHIPNFSKNLYGQTLEFEVLKRIRDEKKFLNIDELKQQIKKDVEECLKL